VAIPKIMAMASVIAALALGAPVATANAQTAPGLSTSTIPCYPYPAFCDLHGNQQAPIPSWWPFSPAHQSPAWSPWTIQLPGVLPQ
jgi:hypothetical protein